MSPSTLGNCQWMPTEKRQRIKFWEGTAACHHRLLAPACLLSWQWQRPVQSLLSHNGMASKPRSGSAMPSFPWDWDWACGKSSVWNWITENGYTGLFLCSVWGQGHFQILYRSQARQLQKEMSCQVSPAWWGLHENCWTSFFTPPVGTPPFPLFVRGELQQPVFIKHFGPSTRESMR